MSKRSKFIGSLALMPILALAACGEDHPQRDVYTGKDSAEAMENCEDDWGDRSLCNEITDQTELKSIQAGRCNNSDEQNCNADAHYVYGPQYMSQHRTVTHNSFVYIPMSSRISDSRVRPIGSTSLFVGNGGATVSRSFSSFSGARAVGAVSISRGGFGATGAHVGSFGGA